MRPATGIVDLARLPAPLAWLERKFGPLRWFELDPPLDTPPAKAPEAPRHACPLDLLHPLLPGAGPDCVLADPEDIDGEYSDHLVRLDGSSFAIDPDEADLQGPPATIAALGRDVVRHFRTGREGP